MHRIGMASALFALATIAFGVSPAFAQNVQVDVRNAPSNTGVEVRVSGDGVADSATGLSDGSGDLSMLLDFGTMGKAQPTRVDVYLEDCENGATVHIVAEGGEAPEDCDEETAGDDCDCRRVGAFWLSSRTTVVTIDWATGAVASNGTGTGFIAGIGADFVSFGGDEPALDPRFSRTLSTDDSGFDITVSGEYMFWPWLGAGFSFENLSSIDLEGELIFLEDPRFSVDSSATIDPWVIELYGRPAYWVHPRVTLFGILGAAYWSVESEGLETVLFNGSPVESFSLTVEKSNWTPVVGGGVDYWFYDWVGVRGSFKWLKLEKEPEGDSSGIDKGVTAGRFLVVFDLSRLVR